MADWLEGQGDDLSRDLRQIARMDEILDWDYWNQEPTGGVVLNDAGFWSAGPETRTDMRRFPEFIHRLVARMIGYAAADRGFRLVEKEGVYELESTSRRPDGERELSTEPRGFPWELVAIVLVITVWVVIGYVLGGSD